MSAIAAHVAATGNPIARTVVKALALAVFATFATGMMAPAHSAGTADAPERTLRTLVIPKVRPDFSRAAPGWCGAAFIAAAAGLGVAAGANDLELSQHISANRSSASQHVADAVRPLGNEVVLAGGVLAWGAAWALRRDGLYTAVQRADLSIAAAAICTYGIKQAVGRYRPEDSPNDTDVYSPFSSHDSFPSGHSTLAFAAAAALDRETSSRWVPAIAYPLAGLVGWSRLYERKHWPSDVVAGAAIGFGVAWKTEDVLRPRVNKAAGTTGARLEFDALDGSLAAVRLRW